MHGGGGWIVCMAHGEGRPACAKLEDSSRIGTKVALCPSCMQGSGAPFLV